MDQSDGNEVELPFVVMVETGRLLEDGVALRITYAASREKFEDRQWDIAVFAMSHAVASGLVKALQREIDPNIPPAPKATRN